MPSQYYVLNAVTVVESVYSVHVEWYCMKKNDTRKHISAWPWWWSSGQGPCILPRQSEFESC